MIKRPGGGVDHPPLTRAEVTDRAELDLGSNSVSAWHVAGEPYLQLQIQYFVRRGPPSERTSSHKNQQLIVVYSLFFLRLFGPFSGHGLPMEFRKNSVL